MSAQEAGGALGDDPVRAEHAVGAAVGADGATKDAAVRTDGATEDEAVPTDGAGAEKPVVEHRLHPVTPLRRAWAPVAVLIGWGVHDPDGAQRQLMRLDTSTLLIGLAVFVPAAALYGFLTWWFTHFAVTDSELRIRTGLLFRRTAHIRLERIQAIDVTRPLLARIAGVAKLRLDVVGTDKKDELAYLGEAHAGALRAELLARAAGFAPDTAHEVGEAPVRQVLKVPAGVLAMSLVLTGATWGTLVAAVVVPSVLWFATESVWTVLATALPLIGAAGASSVGRFVGEYDWTVGDSPDGLRIDHGLLDRAHETVPPGRVQTVRIVEPLLWRRRGWVRVELDVAGSTNSVLLPVAPREVAESVVARVLPGTRVPDATALVRPPGRARWCVPWWWRGYGLAVDDKVFAARHGLLRRRLDLVPHAKVQSVRLSQGPWQRFKGLADVHVDTGANKTVTARLRDADEAAALLRAQAERSRTGRREALPDRWMV
ncbi:PH domain-containing protein [Streptomyces caniscabiei]|uniref:PH domain-containing protein n=1 Tax=Streptomyces caniscabiei TaxID=2746961 RepID=UPI0029B90175|nr:PH domain-containing protein [Streptomyces caniscabiei]MDX2739436.1 PH domain-containing protein [Streptomyces caniscabiei]MDX2779291.1 PH domain-containing protein [Streptomyces caniscabiei]